jgi:hypothetical protein
MLSWSLADPLPLLPPPEYFKEEDEQRGPPPSELTNRSTSISALLSGSLASPRLLSSLVSPPPPLPRIRAIKSARLPLEAKLLSAQINASVSSFRSSRFVLGDFADEPD